MKPKKIKLITSNHRKTLRNYLAMKEARYYLGKSLISIVGYKLLLFYLKFVILNIFKISKER